MERTKIEQLFENYSFWRHLSEEEKKMLQEQIRWCTYEEGQMVTDTGRDCLGIFLVCDGILRANLVSEAGSYCMPDTFGRTLCDFGVLPASGPSV